MWLFFQNLLKNSGCSYCQENDYTDSNDIFNGWSLFVKEYKMFSALLLYNKKSKKDISFYINQNNTINLIKDSKVMLELDFISKDDDDNIAILVPGEKYQEYYESIEKKNKNYDKELKAYYVDTFDLSIKK